MNTITLWNPWASLVAVGAKKIETRSWPIKYRGLLAIHAAKRRLDIQELEGTMCINAMRALGFPAATQMMESLPYGAVIATCRLVDCLEIGAEYMSKWGSEMEYPLPTGNELLFGDYTPGRYAWILGDVRQLPKPIPAKGQQGLWNWEPPEGVIINA